jgi:hypothetical protein
VDLDDAGVRQGPITGGGIQVTSPGWRYEPFGSELAGRGPLPDGSLRVSRGFERGGQVVVGAGVARLPGEEGLELGRRREPFA